MTIVEGVDFSKIIPTIEYANKTAALDITTPAFALFEKLLEFFLNLILLVSII